MPRPLTPLLGLALLAPGCSADESFGAECSARGLLINEIFAANENDPFPPTGGDHPGSDCGKPDWIELKNASGRRVDLGRFSIAPSEEHEAPTLGDGEPVLLDDGDRIVVLALPYDLEAEGECVPGADPDAWPERWLFMGVDLDRDNGRVILRDELQGTCDDIVYPDQHADLSWSRIGDGDPDDCAMTTPTPGTSNDEVLTLYEERYPCSL